VKRVKNYAQKVFFLFILVVVINFIAYSRKSVMLATMLDK
jgi:hypothetical protein